MTSLETNGRSFVETPEHHFRLTKEEILKDYRIACESRAASLLGRREVLTGKAKFGIFGDGKEVPQLAMAKAFRNGDFRSGYYRDQTFMFATGMSSIREFFAQLYAHADPRAEGASGGRLMNSHFGTRLLNEDGSWKPLVNLKNSSSDISPTAGQMPRLLGLAYASKLYRLQPALQEVSPNFSDNGSEVAFGTIGNASTSEGLFFETVNAAGVIGVPLAISVWDDGYGISVPNDKQTTKGSISEMLSGLASSGEKQGYSIYVVKGWDYPALCEAYLAGIEKVRQEHIPALFHIIELTQPQGHSTSGSHERYKSKERLDWEAEFDCLVKFRSWILREDLATENEIVEIENEAKSYVESERMAAYEAYLSPLKKERSDALALVKSLSEESGKSLPGLESIKKKLEQPLTLNRKLINAELFKAQLLTRGIETPAKKRLDEYVFQYRHQNADRYNSFLHSCFEGTPVLRHSVAPVYASEPEMVDGRVLLQRCFDEHFKRDPRIFVIGEDVGKLGDVNLVFEGLQQKYGEWRLTDTGIREATIAGQGIGAALRGLRPIVDIQYLDYLLYALEVLSDDLATLHYRTCGGQKAPVVVRTKGHRLEGVWHSGSPLGVIINALRGMFVFVPRNMTQAAGFYNFALRCQNPSLIIETLNAYRLKEPMPGNIGEYVIPPGLPEVLREGTDITVVTYGPCCRLAQEAAESLATVGISLEIIDVQSLLPFDTQNTIVASLKKTNAVLFLDEDGPGGTTAFMMQQVLEREGGYEYLDAPPRTLTAKAHRPAYGTDGDYFSKPNMEDIVEIVYDMMHERAPARFPRFTTPLYHGPIEPCRAEVVKSLFAVEVQESNLCERHSEGMTCHSV